MLLGGFGLLFEATMRGRYALLFVYFIVWAL